MRWQQVTINVPEMWQEAARAYFESFNVTGTWTEEGTDGVHVHAFFVADRPLASSRVAEFCRELSRFCGGTVSYRIELVDGADWELAYKRYLRPLAVGKRLLLVPCRDMEVETEGKTVVRFDPGISFGTGHHATTRLIVEELEKQVSGGERVLDAGTGSGVLGLCCAVLGAREVVAIDNDPVAVRNAGDNAAISGANISVLEMAVEEIEQLGTFDLIVSNLTAEVFCSSIDIWRKCAHEGTSWLLSGIIDSKWDEVRAALEKAGWRVVHEKRSDVWVMARAEPRWADLE